ncbi:hypothetical protein [Paracoccus laeviglucosivorans]|uniref:Uncharacterized protein n=1 Tax=Paracoccus laeviglucosivorans TaxID=1197861 RepID=A0A521BWW7_9RHOB|nr:hypothetical protein [Paracoccus laeviglucosivorans]SMO51692.1 hypothetical protein SAMN06265221_103190 [Paracoccus laeviglucosivorans]
MRDNQFDEAVNGTVTNPSLGVGLNGLHDWSTAQPFLDHFKMARPWTGRQGDTFGAVSFQELQAGGYIDGSGWLLGVPEDVDGVSVVLLTELDPNATDLAGRYAMTWDGQGRINVLGGTELERIGNRIEFDFIPGWGRLVEIRVTQVEQPIRNIRVIKLDNERRYDAGNIFRIEWLDMVRNYRLVRFMDWMLTNNSQQSEWRDRPRVSDAFYTWRGAPVEVMVRLANAIGADPWFNMAHLASDGYMRSFAAYVRRYLKPGLRAHYEYSNEMWNMQFDQTQWAIERAREVWPDQGDGFVQWYAAGAVRMAQIVGQAHEDDPSGCVRIISTHTHWQGLEWAILEAPNWRAGDPMRRAPYQYFDAYAVSGYFDGGLDRDENVARVRDLLAQGSAAKARTVLCTQMLQGGWPESGRTVANLRETWDYQATIAKERGLSLIMYEGGTHIVPPAEVRADPALRHFYEQFNYSTEMAQVYAAALTEWRAAGGALFNLFVECARVADFGYWGLQRHVGDENPRWGVVELWNRENAGAADRPEGSFIGSYEISDR